VPEGVKDADSEGQGDAEGENRALREGAALALGAERVGGGDGEWVALAVAPPRNEPLPAKEALPEGEREGAPLRDADGHAVALGGVPVALAVAPRVSEALREGAGEREGDSEGEGLEKLPPPLPLGCTLLLGATLFEALALRVRLALSEGERLSRGEALSEGHPPLGVGASPVPLADGERDGKGECEGMALPVLSGREAEAHTVSVAGSELEMVHTAEGDGSLVGAGVPEGAALALPPRRVGVGAGEPVAVGGEEMERVPPHGEAVPLAVAHAVWPCCEALPVGLPLLHAVTRGEREDEGVINPLVALPRWEREIEGQGDAECDAEAQHDSKGERVGESVSFRELLANAEGEGRLALAPAERLSESAPLVE
jgi:hypothetical protein